MQNHPHCPASIILRETRHPPCSLHLICVAKPRPGQLSCSGAVMFLEKNIRSFARSLTCCDGEGLHAQFAVASRPTCWAYPLDYHRHLLLTSMAKQIPCRPMSFSQSVRMRHQLGLPIDMNGTALSMHARRPRYVATFKLNLSWKVCCAPRAASLQGLGSRLCLSQWLTCSHPNITCSGFPATRPLTGGLRATSVWS